MMETTVSLQEQAGNASAGISSKKRLDAVDLCKGILIFAVVLSHAWFAKPDLLGRYFPYSMPAFFFLAGYVYQPGRTYWKNIGRRVIQLLIPYFLFSIYCNALYPIYLKLTNTWWDPAAFRGLWIACLKGDAMNMLMSTPMWFLTSLFTASIVFFAIADPLRKSVGKSIAVIFVLIALTFGIEIIKKGVFIVWHLDYALFGCAMMLLGAMFGQKRLLAEFRWRTLILGLVLLFAAAVLNRFFPGSGKTSVVQYIENGKPYGVFTAFAIAVSGSIGLLGICTLLAKVPGVRHVFCWLGRNSIWILCIHYSAEMIIELWLFNHHYLTNSLIQVIMKEMYGYGYVWDTKRDIMIKVLVAVASILISAVYAVIHNSVKKAIRKHRAEKAAA